MEFCSKSFSEFWTKTHFTPRSTLLNVVGSLREKYLCCSVYFQNLMKWQNIERDQCIRKHLQSDVAY